MSKSDVARLLDTLTSKGASEQAPRVLFVRASSSQKAFIARALHALESLSDAIPLRRLRMPQVLDALIPLESEAAERGLLELAECTRATNLLATALFSEDELSTPHSDAMARLVRLLSTLLLRVYITGTDAGGHIEREQAQRLVRSLSPRSWGHEAVAANWTAH